MPAEHDSSPDHEDFRGDDGSQRYDAVEACDSPDADDVSERYDGMDALLAAIMDAPLPERARADAAFMAGHRSALADVALLREQLGVIADVLAEPAESPAPARRPVQALRPPRPRSRLLPVTLRVVGVAAAGVMVAGLGWLLAQAGNGANDSASSATGSKADTSTEAGSGSLLGDPGYLACARLVVEGDVTKVAREPGAGLDSVTLHVTRSYKPERGKDEVGFVLEADTDPMLSEGDHVLVGISRGSASPDVWIVGDREIARERAAVQKALPQSHGAPCEQE
ncbi:hypothetical protein [Streptomyces griseus]|uniref:hypothetical protein n=1 Tax=Streptomyces griseus TaxID=1911 RepID=UPI0006896F8E|nr:hypothetical protein [Streptomyces griseus]